MKNTLDFTELQEILSKEESFDLIWKVINEMYDFDGQVGQWKKEFYINLETKKLECSGIITSNSSINYSQTKIYCGEVQSWNVDEDYSFYEIENYDEDDLKRLSEEGCMENGRIIKVPEWAVDNTDVKYDYACEILNRLTHYIELKEYENRL